MSGRELPLVYESEAVRESETVTEFETVTESETVTSFGVGSPSEATGRAVGLQ